jgi:transforming growth factor-beta-induced protein
MNKTKEFSMKKLTVLFILAIFTFVSCANTEGTAEQAAVVEVTEALLSIAEIAVEDGRFTTLVAALDAADLVATLAGEGDFTVFAPTDEAFARLPEGTVEALLNDIPALTEILLYHVVSGSVYAETVVTLDSATTLQGTDVTINLEMGNVYINDALVLITDIQASNGVIHVIDSVILPN